MNKAAIICVACVGVAAVGGVVLFRHVKKKKKNESAKKMLDIRAKADEALARRRRERAEHEQKAENLADSLHPTDDEGEFFEEECTWNDPFEGDANIEIISEDEYEIGGNAYAKEHMTYYELDRVLTFDSGDIVYEPSELIGDGLKRFGESSQDPDVVYVRNKDLRIDYEITRISEAYNEIP